MSERIVGCCKFTLTYNYFIGRNVDEIKFKPFLDISHVKLLDRVDDFGFVYQSIPFYNDICLTVTVSVFFEP